MNIFAYTPCSHPYPPYISLNECGDSVELTVRSAPKGAVCGESAVIMLPRDVFDQFIQQSRAYLAARA